ncbi:MAG: cytochrome c-type biogenesis CcmF C-terminal domain-containing protein [Myxococcaceae bacterium]
MNSTLGFGFVLLSIAFAAFGGVAGIVGGLTRREALYPWIHRSATGFFLSQLAANGVMVYALLTRDFSVSYVAQVGSHATPTLFTIVSLWSALEGSILFWGVILGGYIFAFSRVHRNDPPRFVTLSLGTMLAVSVFFTYLIAAPANPFLPMPPPIPLDGPGPNPLLQNHILMVIHPPMLYLGYVGMTVPFGIAVAGLLGGEMGESWMAPLRRWTLIPWVFLTIGIVLGSWWAYAVLGWGGYWAWDPVENASFLPWLTATAFLHSTMVQERKRMLKVWTIALALASFWLTILGTFMTRSGVFNSVHSFTQSDIGPTFLVFLAVIAVVCIGLLSARGHLLVAENHFRSLASREVSFLVNNLLFIAFTFTVFIGTVFPLIVEGLQDRRISIGEPYFNAFAVPLGMLVLFLMGVGPVLPWGAGDPKKVWKQLLPPAAAGVLVVLVCYLAGARGFAPLMTFGLAGFVTVVTLKEMFLPAWIRVRERKEDVFTAVFQSASRARRRFGGYVVHLGVVMVIVAVAASSAYKKQTSGTLSKGESLTIDGYTMTFDGIARGREPHREWVGAKLNVTTASGATDTLIPKMNFYERSTDPIGTPAVRVAPQEDLYVSLMAHDETSQTASIKVWTFPMVVWIWGSLPLFALGTLIAIWPARRKRIAVASSTAPEKELSRGAA